MKQYKQKQIREFVKLETAIDITNYSHEQLTAFMKNHDLEKVGYSIGINGINGAILQDRKTGKYYAVTKRNGTLLTVF